MVKQPFQECSWDCLYYWELSSESILFFITWCEYSSVCYSATWLSDLLLGPLPSLRNWGSDTLGRVRRPKQRHLVPFRTLRTAKKSARAGRQRSSGHLHLSRCLAEHTAAPHMTLLTYLSVVESYTSSLCEMHSERICGKASKRAAEGTNGKETL